MGTRAPNCDNGRMTSFGTLGSRVDELRSSAFFQWFCLEQAGTNGALTVFRPSGLSFHDEVTLEAWTGAGGALAMLRLCLSRSFIDNAQSSAFALDITKSFLAGALGKSALSAAFEREMASSAISLGTQRLPERVSLTPQEERVFEVYRGAKQTTRVESGALTLSAENDTRNGVAVMVFSLAGELPSR